MKELFKEHVFGAKVREVYDFMADFAEYEENEFEDYPGLSCYLEIITDYERDNAATIEYKVDYKLVITVSVDMYDFGKSETFVTDKQLAEIKFRKEGKCNCKTEFWVETELSEWSNKGSNTWDVPKKLGKRCLESYWQFLIQEWNDRLASKDDNQQESDKVGASEPISQNLSGSKKFVFDTSPGNFEKGLRRCSNQMVSLDMHRFTWETMEPKPGINLELIGFLAPTFSDGHKGFMRIQVLEDSPRLIKVQVDYQAEDKPAMLQFEELLEELDKLGRFWITQESKEEVDTGPNNDGDFTVDEVISLIDSGIFDGCKMDRDTIKKTIEAILWLVENTTDRLTVQAVAKRVNYSREHYYNFRAGCNEIGIKKINGIDVIRLRKNN